MSHCESRETRARTYSAIIKNDGINPAPNMMYLALSHQKFHSIRRYDTHEMMIVMRAYSGCKMLATIPPAAAATMGDTTGRSHTPVTFGTLCICRVNLRILGISRDSREEEEGDIHHGGSPIQTVIEMTLSIHQQAQASIAKRSPNAGYAKRTCRRRKVRNVEGREAADIRCRLQWSRIPLRKCPRTETVRCGSS